MSVIIAYCQLFADKLSEQDKCLFRELKDNLSRIKFLYPFAANFLKLPSSLPKDMSAADKFKCMGNEHFSRKQYSLAIKKYNEGVFKCPQKCEEGRKLRAILIANRSAAFYELQMYEKVLKDIEILEVYDHHPNPCKLYIRGAKASEALGKYTSAVRFFGKALKEIEKLNKTPNETIKRETSDIEIKIDKLKTKLDVEDKPSNLDDDSLQSCNTAYPALSSKVSIKYEPKVGRFAVATADIQAGEIIGIERPFVCVLEHKTYRDHCSQCTIATDQMIVCENCSEACYCSFNCLEKSSSYHAKECPILFILYHDKVAVNCLMALRCITKYDLADLIREESKLRMSHDETVYRTEDYRNVCNLVSHQDKIDDFMLHSLTGVYLLRLLKCSNYFGIDRPDGDLNEDEAFVGSLIMRHLQILKFNAHEISELGKNPEDESKKLFGTEGVGAGLYPTLALFNHSCDPSILRYNVGNKKVYRSIKSIKTGEGIFENYGPIFLSDIRSMRRQKMMDLYGFFCECKACVEDWPLLKDIRSDPIPLSCPCGGTVPVFKENEDFKIKCPKCNIDFKIMNSLLKIMALSKKVEKVESLFNEGKLENCVKVIAKILDEYKELVVFPFFEGLVLQEKLQICLLHKGNKTIEFK